MSEYKNPLSQYNSAVSEGIADVNSKLKEEIQNNISNINKIIEELNKNTDESNKKIKSLQTQKISATKAEKKELEQSIAALREQIFLTKIQISNHKEYADELKEFSKKIKEGYTLINAGVSDFLTNSHNEIDSIFTKYKLFEINNKNNTQRLNEGSEEYLTQQHSIQKNSVEQVFNAYKKMIELYGEEHEESVKLEKQLLQECLAYEKIKESLNALKSAEGFSLEERKAAVFSMNDYLKNNFNTLQQAGYSKEEIYDLARKVSGYDKVYESSFYKEEKNKADILVEELLKEFENVGYDFIKGFESRLSDFSDSLFNAFSALGEAAATVGGSYSITGDTYSDNKTYNSTYNISQGKDQSISDVLFSIRNFDTIKKARNL